MLRRSPPLLVVLLAAVFALLLPPASGVAAGPAAGAVDSRSLGPVRFGPEVDLGVQQVTRNVTDAVVATEDGRPTMYGTAAGDTAVFSVVDVLDNRLLRSFPLPGVQQVWRHAVAPDGTVYIAAITTTGAALWSYSPADDTVHDLGALPGESSPWSMTTDPQGRVYLGTYPNGKVFRYDPDTRAFHDYGTVVAGQDYVRSMAFHDGFLYAGIGSTGDVVRLDVATGARSSIADQVPALLGVAAEDVPFAYDMAVVDGWLFVKFAGDQNRLLFYDLAAGRWSEKSVGKNTASDAGVFSFNQLESRDGKVYVTNNRQLEEIDTATLDSRPTGIPYGASLRGAAWLALTDPELPGTSLVTMQSSGSVTAFDVASGRQKVFPSVLAGVPNPLHQLERAPDGTLYMSGYPGGTGARFDPRTGRTTTFPMGQAEGMVGLGDTLYAGIYPGGVISTVRPGQDGVPKATEVFRVGEGQDRPYAMTAHDGKLLIGTIPDYGRLGGALTVYDPADGTRRTYRDVVHNQSVVGLAQRGHLIYGSTSVHVVRGTAPTEKEAKIFVWDTEQERKVAEFTLDLPGLDTPPLISGLTFGRDGLLWGAADGFVFAVDPTTLKVVKYRNIHPDVRNYGMWRPIYLRWGADGNLYTTLASRLTVIDPRNLKSVTVSDPGEEITFMTLARDAAGRENIYFLGADRDAHLRMVPVSHPPH